MFTYLFTLIKNSKKLLKFLQESEECTNFSHEFYKYSLFINKNKLPNHIAENSTVNDRTEFLFLKKFYYYIRNGGLNLK